MSEKKIPYIIYYIIIDEKKIPYFIMYIIKYD